MIDSPGVGRIYAVISLAQTPVAGVNDSQQIPAS